MACGSASNGSKKNADSVTVVAVPLPPAGTVVDSVSFGKHNSYALYLPLGFSKDKKYPCIFFFDAHARGAMPLRMYKNLADKYGFVMVGSNDSKNGTDFKATNELAMTMKDDVLSRTGIDPTRIYMAGFSGGARVASSIAILDGGVAGVIGCAAGFPQLQEEIRNKFDYCGLVGIYDFNLGEMEQLDGTLDQNGFTHQLLTINGRHGWPPAEDFNTALLWEQLSAMKRGIQPKNDSFIAALKADYERRIKNSIAVGDPITTQQLLQGMIRCMDGLTDVSDAKKQSIALAQNNDYKTAISMHTQIREGEQAEQQQIMQDFMAKDEKWWTAKIAELNTKAGKGATQEAQMNRRLLNYLGLVGYMASNRAILTGDLTNAPVYLKIFRMADPDNADCSFLSAMFYMRKGNKDEAIKSLQLAANQGYSEVPLLLTTPEFAPIQNDATFKDVVTKVRANAAGL